ncbi:MAG: type II toxin-antitoxin system VapC family toxin [bacterium]|nr:type II toxin-antitoxin system VapC family toxin [bacterium]
MSRYVLDTSAYSYFKRGDPQVVNLIDSAEWLGIPLVTVGELEVGFLLGMPELLEENRETLLELMDDPVVEDLGLDHEVSRIYAEILVSLRRAGTPIPTNDIWIAAIAARAGAIVLTYDTHFHDIQRIGSIVLTPP